jgi:hypothetical protein
LLSKICFSEDPSYEENELKKYRDFSCMCCNVSHAKASGRRGDFIASDYEDNIASRYSDDKSDESEITGIDST